LLEIALVAFDLESDSKLTQVLFFKFKRNATTLKYAQGKATIFEQVLAGNREQVSQPLEAYRKAHVGEVKFPPPPAAAERSVSSAVRRRAGAR
jgi:hypothetical protein